jgi:Carbamoylphosphate synthase large subunit (split gene in MJ)
MRPSYVLGGRDMRIVYNEEGIRRFMAIPGMAGGEHPVLLDQFLKDAIEVDVDAVSDGRQTVVGGIMEHIEEAGIHSGDSACVLPPYTLSPAIIQEITAATKAMAADGL